MKGFISNLPFKIFRLLKSTMNSVNNKPALLWIDLEMSGLDPQKNRILEIAAILTDFKCTNLISGPQLIIQCDKVHLDKMDQWCTKTHTQSGLVKRCLESKISVEDAEKSVLQWLTTQNISAKQLMIAGNSVHVDRIFVKKYMPKLDEFLHYRILDVTSIKIMMNSYAPQIQYLKKGSHRALDDIIESINEYKTYTEYLFKNK